MRSLLLIFLFLSSASISFSQTPMPKIDYIGESSNLFLEDEVLDVKVGMNGYLWIITSSEIIKYNGESFTKISSGNVDNGPFLKFYESPQGQNYITCLEGGIYFVDSDTLREYEKNEILKSKNEDRLASEVLMDSSGAFYSSIQNSGILYINKGKLEVSESLNKIAQLNGLKLIFRENMKPLFHSRWDNNLPISKWNGEKAKLYIVNESGLLVDSINDSYSNYNSHSEVQLPNKNYLLAAGTEHLLEVSPSGFIQKIPKKNPVLNLFIDSRQNLWISYLGLGVYCYKNAIISDENVEVFFENTTTVICSEDLEGNIWGYSEKEGLVKISSLSRRFYQFSDPTFAIHSLEKKEHFLFLNNGKEGLLALNLKDGSKQIISVSNEEMTDIAFEVNKDEEVKDIEYVSSSNLLWTAIRSQLQFFDNNQWNSFNYCPPIEGTDQYFLSEGTDSTLIGICSSYYIFINGKKISYVSKSFGLNQLYDVLIIGDTTLVSTQKGVFLDTPDDRIFLGDQYRPFNQRLNDMLSWNGELWMSTKEDGVFILRKDSLEEVKYLNHKILNAKFVNQNDTTLWLLSDLASLKITQNGVKQSIVAYNALPKLHLTDVEIEDSLLFIATKNDGLLKVSFNHLMQNPIKIPLLDIEKIRIGTSFISDITSSPTLNHRNNTIEFFYQGISYDRRPLKYRYRLIGLSGVEWSSSDESFVQFTNLEAGDYRFEVQVKKDRQFWSSSKVFSFSILPPFWETWWFTILWVFVTILLIYAIIRYRIKVTNRENSLIISGLNAEQKALRAKIDPHYLFNVISSIQYLIEEEPKEKAIHFLDMFATSMRNVLKQTNENDIAIRDEIKFLKEYIEMERFRLENHFQFKIENELNSTKELIPAFVVQPFVENAIQHGLKNKADNGSLHIVFKQKEQKLIVIVEDNGIGREKASQFKKDKRNLSQGIQIIEDRLRLHNREDKNVVIEDLYDADQLPIGTRVTLYIRIISN